MIRAIAVDDEPIALDVIRNHSEKIPFLNLCQTFLSATEALVYLKNETVQLIFLDINMPDLSGLEFAEMVGKHIQIIFTTAHPEHAVIGFELAATDYLLKPINYARFLKACQLAEMRLLNPQVENHSKENSFFVKDGYNWVKIKLSNLLYAQSEDNYISLFETEKRTVTRMTMTELCDRLPTEQFVRVHNSYLVSLSGIDKIEKHQIIIDGKKIPVSEKYRTAFMDKVLNWK